MLKYVLSDVYMEKDRFGKFLIHLRREKKLTQYELAEIIPVGREAISKWERGKTKPNKSSLERLSEIFNVSVEELLLGKRLNKSKKQELQKLALELYGKKLILQKVIKILIIIIILLLLSFFIYYFVNSYNSIKVYTLNEEQEHLVITDGIFVITKENIYFNLGNISNEEYISNLKLFYKEDNEENLIYRTDDSTINLYDYYGYNSYFEYNKVKYIIKNMYLDISYKDGTEETIKLNFERDFTNDQIFNNVKNNISEESRALKSNVNIDNIKNIFKFQNGIYTFESDNLIFSYIEDNNFINLVNVNENSSKEWNFYIDYNQVEFNEYEDKAMINSFNYIDGEIICNIPDCEEKIEEIEYFYIQLEKILE